MNKVKIAFLDRDGTINKEIDHLHRIEDFEFIPGTPEAIRKLKSLGYMVFIISNQAGIAKGMYPEDDVITLHKYISGELAGYGAEPDGIYYCPHHPDGIIKEFSISCTCRKPATGMIDRIKSELLLKNCEIDFAGSFIAGDTERDMITGKNAGIGTKVLLRSGHSIDESNTCADIIEDSLFSYVSSLSERK